MTEPSWIVVDTETSIKCPIGTNKASAFWPDNKIVLAGSRVNGETEIRIRGPGGFGIYDPKQKTVFIGQNIKFDLHHLRKAATFSLDLGYKGLKIWDTQIAEYVLTNQQSRFASLDDMAKKYGGTIKPNEIKEYWDSGVDTEDIPKAKLESYLKGDVENTDRIAAAQMRAVSLTGQGPLVWSQMDAALAVADIEYNGLYIDQKALSKYRAELEGTLLTLKQALRLFLPTSVRNHVNLGSTQDLAAVLFGGEIEWVEEVDSHYKNGKPRKQKVKHSQHVAGMMYGNVSWRTPSGKWSTSEEVLEEICGLHGPGTPPGAIDFASTLLRYRFVQKEISTYAEGLQKLIYPDGMLHANIHTCATHTGRYSSSNPNLQNMPSSAESKIRDCFTSRFGHDGRIVTADFKQLEVVALAFLSRDKQLMADIRDGRDIHFETGKLVFGWKVPGDMTPDSRRIVKTINFGLIYGGGAKTLSKQAKCELRIAKGCIDAFYSRYPDTATWHAELLREIKANETTLGKKDSRGVPVHTSYLRLCTGRVFEIDEAPIPWDKASLTVSWPVNKIKNYPVQGLATGDIVPLLLGKVWQEFQNSDILRDRALFVNVVHDEIVLDVHSDVIDSAVQVLKTVLESGPEIFERTFGVEFDLPLRVDINVGNSWGECKK